MRWRKLGRIFAAAGQRPWMRTHCSMPFGEPLDDRRLRVWFSPRDGANRSHTAWLEIDVREPDRVLALAEEPVLGPGPVGSFDDCGAMPSWIVRHGGERRLYYIGWNVPTTVPFRNAVGLATDDGRDGVAFRRAVPGPVLDRGPHDPYFVATPCVMVEGRSWHMWYLSGTGWTGEPPAARYDIRYATSLDGVHWDARGLVCIGWQHPGEIAIARPSVLRDGDLWRMWFSYRGTDFPYRLGYAESEDGLSWRRRDRLAGLRTGGTGWDSAMIAYPHVFDMGGARYMLYAGDGFGQAGMGLAVLDSR
ncbi:MAG: hypothetical protein AB7G39_08530 [Alphaproteobacteria bacterium]